MYLYKLRTVFILSFLIVSSCKNSDRKNLPISTGKPGSLVIVSSIETKHELKLDLEHFFLDPDTNGIIPFYEIISTTAGEFVKSHKTEKTVLVIVTEATRKELKELLETFSDEEIKQNLENTKSGIIARDDIFAKHQHIYYLFGKNNGIIKNKLSSNQQPILSNIIKSDIADQSEILFSDTGENVKFYSIFKSKYGIGVKIPESFKLTKSSNNFYWFQMGGNEEGSEKNIGLIIHAYPYKDTSDFSYFNIRTVRDTFCKHHILGDLPGTYMGTSESDYYPARTLKMIEINGYKACKLNGWWTIKGLSMAGPFIRYIVHVPEKNILFAFEGFVYRPEPNLRERDLKIIEAIALSIK